MPGKAEAEVANAIRDGWLIGPYLSPAPRSTSETPFVIV